MNTVKRKYYNPVSVYLSLSEYDRVWLMGLSSGFSTLPGILRDKVEKRLKKIRKGKLHLETIASRKHGKERRKNVDVCFLPETKSELKAMADKFGCSLSSLVRELCLGTFSS